MSLVFCNSFGFQLRTIRLQLIAAVRTVLIVTLVACGGKTEVVDTGELPIEEPSDVLFAMDRLLQVEIEVDEADWDVLREQGRTFGDVLRGDCLAEPFESPYDWFEATITIDGEELGQVGIRKKGFIGSLNSFRPSLKISMDRIVSGQTYANQTRLTFNNQNQDVSRINACMAYSVFADAGLAASRCNLAHVTVNGVSLGVYNHVESIKPPMLDYHFGNSDGALLEGTLSDFREDWMGTFDAKNDAADEIGEDFAEIARILEESPDSELIADLDQYFDMDHFFRFWAMEALIGHWDSYTGNTNNYWMYRDESDNRFKFIPWGVDAVLRGKDPFGEYAPRSVTTSSSISNRLYQIEEGRERYFEALSSHLENVWDEEVLIERMEAFVEMAQPIEDDMGNIYFEDSVDELRRFLNKRRSWIEKELEDGYPEVEVELGEPPCFVQLGSIEASFETTYGSMYADNIFEEGEGSCYLEYEGEEFDLPDMAGVAGADGEGSGLFGVAQVFEDSSAILAYAAIPESMVEANTSFEFDWMESWGVLLYAPPNSGFQWILLSYMDNGAVSFGEASSEWGGAVDGTIYGDLVGFGE